MSKSHRDKPLFLDSKSRTFPSTAVVLYPGCPLEVLMLELSPSTNENRISGGGTQAAAI